MFEIISQINLYEKLPSATCDAMPLLITSASKIYSYFLAFSNINIRFEYVAPFFIYIILDTGTEQCTRKHRYFLISTFFFSNPAPPHFILIPAQKTKTCSELIREKRVISLIFFLHTVVIFRYSVRDCLEGFVACFFLCRGKFYLYFQVFLKTPSNIVFDF